VFDFTSVLQSRGFSIYLNGHAHTLTQYQIDGQGAYVTSGAGSLVDTPDQQSPSVLRKLNNESEEYILDSTGHTVPKQRNILQVVRGGYNSHTYQTIFNLKVAGYT
jgi:hypothetical protein